MSDPPRTVGARTYAREIERRWSQVHEGPLILSPKEWALISDWYGRAIPLQLIEEAIEAVVQTRRGGRAPRSLTYVAPAVDESWQVLVDGRRSRGHPDRKTGGERQALRCWRQRMEAEEVDSKLRALLAELLEAERGGAAAERLEARLDAGLVSAMPPERLTAVLQRIERDLEPFADRMSPETRRDTERAATLNRLRHELSLPRLT